MTGSGSSSRWALVIVGVVFGLAGLVAGILLAFVAPDRKLDDAVSSLAPAPVGCETSLRFDSPGTYYVFDEVSGSVGDLGDCDNDDRPYDYTSGQRPTLELTLLDSSGDEVRINEDTSVSYDRGDQRGQSRGAVRISDAGDYVLRVAGEGDAAEAMVRVGSDPNVSTETLRLGGIAAIVVGLVAAIALTALSRRGGTASAPIAAAPAADPAQVPFQHTGPPAAPPTPGSSAAGPPTAGGRSWVGQQPTQQQPSPPTQPLPPRQPPTMAPHPTSPVQPPTDRPITGHPPVTPQAPEPPTQPPIQPMPSPADQSGHPSTSDERPPEGEDAPSASDSDGRPGRSDDQPPSWGPPR